MVLDVCLSSIIPPSISYHPELFAPDVELADINLLVEVIEPDTLSTPRITLELVASDPITPVDSVLPFTFTVGLIASSKLSEEKLTIVTNTDVDGAVPVIVLVQVSTTLITHVGCIVMGNWNMKIHE